MNNPLQSAPVSVNDRRGSAAADRSQPWNVLAAGHIHRTPARRRPSPKR